jgi:hypothetical protein
MLTLKEFKIRYAQQLEGMSESMIKSYYFMYLEDPFEFHPDMIG